MKAPATIIARHNQRFEWRRLDPAKAQHGATWGLRGPHGTTYLLTPCSLYPGWTHQVVAIGQYSGLYNIESGEGHADLARKIDRLLAAQPAIANGDIDEKVSRREFESWVIESAP